MKTYDKKYVEKMIKDCKDYLMLHPNVKDRMYYGMNVSLILQNWESYLLNNY